MRTQHGWHAPTSAAFGGSFATDRQAAFITRLTTERGVPAVETSTMSREQATRLITQLLAMPRATMPTIDAPAVISVTECGMYRTADGSIYKVQKSKEAGHLYAKKLTPIGGQRLSEEDKVVRWEFAYERGALRALTPAMRMTLDDAKTFGIQFGVCCVCGAFLKDAKSVASGIGPVCAKRV